MKMNYYCIGGDKVLGKQFRQLITNDHLRISMTELAHVTGVSTSQIRYWERKGYISSKQSDKNKNHYFSFLTLFRVATIKYFLDQGFTLATAVKKERERQELGKIFRTFIADQVKAITQLGPKTGKLPWGPWQMTLRRKFTQLLIKAEPDFTAGQ